MTKATVVQGRWLKEYARFFDWSLTQYFITKTAVTTTQMQTGNPDILWYFGIEIERKGAV